MGDLELLSTVGEIRQEIMAIDAAMKSAVYRLDAIIKRTRNMPSLDVLLEGVADTRARKAIGWAAYELGCRDKAEWDVSPVLSMEKEDWLKRRNLGPKTYAIVCDALAPYRKA
jgi:hypothetical protein